VDYFPRVADSELVARLRRSGAVLIEGAKGCGKTETARRIAASELRVETDPAVQALIDAEPERLLRGPTPRLLDEWQRQPRLWDMVRRAVDDRREPGQFILTGSTTPDDSVERHPGLGRFSVLRMRPMSLFEAGRSSHQVSWLQIRAGAPVVADDVGWGLDELAELVVKGGWPAMASADVATAREYVLDYLDLLAEVDIGRVSGVRRDPVRVRRLLASVARNVSTEASAATLARDLPEAGRPLDRETVTSYLGALERLMIVEDLPAWQTSLRDSATLRKSPKRHLVDPSLAAAALGATPEKLLREPKTLGQLFESMALRDLRIYAAPERGRIYHYRDSVGREIDAIIAYPDGWVACEIKLGGGQAEAAAASLKAAVAAIDTQMVGPPAALCVITGTGPGYRRQDGVIVVPIGALGP
jgi:predicted AAA+ superfamily ATPase